GAVGLGQVGGGESTRWYWGSKVSSLSLEQAFEDSLRAVGMFPTTAKAARFALNVEMLSLDQPLSYPLPADTTVTLAVNYTLVDRWTGALLYRRTLRNAATVDLTDRLLPLDRLRQANETVTRQSIALLLRDLVELQPAEAAMPPAPLPPAVAASKPEPAMAAALPASAPASAPKPTSTGKAAATTAKPKPAAISGPASSATVAPVTPAQAKPVR
ncbi:MAG TPA: hypothetical protein VGE47_08840, partial [Burkholderiaceae bacterium]